MRREIRTVMGATDWMLLLALGTLWGGSYFFGKVALAQLPPFTVAVGRLGLAALVLRVAVARGRSRNARVDAGLASVLGHGPPQQRDSHEPDPVGPDHHRQRARRHSQREHAALHVLLAHVFTRDERMTAKKVGGVLFGLAGVAVMIGPDAWAGCTAVSSRSWPWWGRPSRMACAGIFGRRFAGTPPLVTAAGQVTASSVTLLPLSLFFDRPWLSGSPGARTWTAPRRPRALVHGPRLRHLLFAFSPPRARATSCS